MRLNGLMRGKGQLFACRCRHKRVTAAILRHRCTHHKPATRKLVYQGHKV